MIKAIKMKTNYVTYEQALALRELGFPQVVDYMWYSIYNETAPIIQEYDYYDHKISVVCAPTIDQALQWLRYIKGVDIEFTHAYDYDKYTYTLVKKGDDGQAVTEYCSSEWEDPMDRDLVEERSVWCCINYLSEKRGDY